MVVNLAKDDCKDYQFWTDYFQKHDNIACAKLSSNTNLNATARNLKNKAIKLGYTCEILTYEKRNTLLDDIHEINTSASFRQGKPMKRECIEYPKIITGSNKCDYHFSYWYGCFKDGKLVAYIACNYAGELVNISMILGHVKYQTDGIMYLLADYVMHISFIHFSSKYCIYSLWSDGTNGLRQFKHNLGFRITNLQ